MRDLICDVISYCPSICIRSVYDKTIIESLKREKMKIKENLYSFPSTRWFKSRIDKLRRQNDEIGSADTCTSYNT